MTRRHTLVQYRPTRLELSDRAARELGRAAGNALALAVDPEPGWWVVTAQKYVGSIKTDDVDLLLRPKVPAENLFVLLEVGVPEAAWRQLAVDYATTFDLLPSVVAFFARTVESTLARGVLRSYRHEHDRLVALRGRIDIAGQFRNPGLVTPVACHFDEFTADVIENRYLRAALSRSLRVPGVKQADRRRLMHQLVALHEVNDAPVRPDDADRITFTRLNQHYKPAICLARLILENLTLVDQRGPTSASAFLLDMNKLFEDFVSERLRRSLQGRLEVVAQGSVSLDIGGRLPMRPDLQFRQRGQTVFVADVKYKLTADAKGRNEDFYQLLAYTTALRLGHGLLIYCLDENASARSTSTAMVRHVGTSLHLRALDLSGPPEDIATELDRLADWVAQVAAVQRQRPPPRPLPPTSSASALLARPVAGPLS